MLFNSMRTCDESVEECMVVEHVLRTLTPQFHIQEPLEHTTYRNN